MKDLWMLFPGGRSKALTLSYDDGVEQDIRLIDIMNRHGLKGTFNLNGGLFAPEGTVYPKGQVHRRMSKQAALDLYSHSGQEIALHAMHHSDLPNVPAAYAAWQIVREKEVLEDMFSRIIRGMAYPYGTTSPDVAAMLQSCGIAYARTTESTLRSRLPDEWLRMPATCHHKNPQLMELAHKFVEEAPWGPQLFYLWGHSYEFEGCDNWHVIEAFADYIGGRASIWYATNIEIYDYVTAWRSMHISANGKRLHNPSAITLWIRSGGRIYQLESGCDLILP